MRATRKNFLHASAYGAKKRGPWHALSSVVTQPSRPHDPQHQLASPQGASIAERIRHRLRELGWKPLTLGKLVSPTRPGNVYDWLGKPAKNGKPAKPPRQDPSAETLIAIARELGMSTDELLGMAAGQEPPFAAWGEFMTRLEERGDSLSDRERKKMVLDHFEADEEPDVAYYERKLVSVRTTIRRK